MATIETSALVRIDVAAGTAFDFVADARNNPRWQGGMVACEWLGGEPPITVGSRYRQHARFLGRDVRSVFEVVEFDPAGVIAARTLGVDEGGVPGGFPITFRRTVSSLAEGGCLVETLVTGDPGRFFGFAGPLMGWMVGRSIRADYERLRELLES